MAVIEEDLTAVAGLYSQIAGVSAGFIFTAVIVVVTASPDGERRRPLTHVLLSMLFAFFGLTMTSLTYAAIAGENNRPEVAAALHALAGTGFLIAAQFSLYAIITWISLVSNDPAVTRLGRALGLFAPVPMFALVSLGFNYNTDRRYPQHAPAWTWLLPVVLLVLLLVLAVLGNATQRRHDTATVRVPSVPLTRLGPAALVVMTLCSTAAVGISSINYGRGEAPPIGVAVTALVVAFAAASVLPAYFYLTSVAVTEDPAD